MGYPYMPRMSATPSAVATRRSTDTKSSILLIAFIYWLVIARLIIPGLGDYSADADILAIAARDAVFNKITWLSFLFIPMIMIARRSALTMRVLRATNVYFLALLGFAIVSIAWSIDTGASASRITHMITIVLICIACVVVGWNPRRVQELSRPILLIMLIGSLIFGILSPDLAWTPPVPPDMNFYLHGLAPQKNGLGSIASLAAVFYFHGWASRELRPLPFFFGFSISCLCLVLCRSSTGVMASALVCIFLTMMLRSSPAMRRYKPYFVGGFVVFTVAYSMAVLKVVPGLDVLLSPVQMLSGKDATFTARTQIWAIIREHIQQHQLLGTGYGGYWAGPIPSSPSYVFLDKMYFYPAEAHNGYLDIINDLGYVGLLVLIGYLVTFLRQGLKLLRSNFAQAALYLALLFQQLLTNLSETHWIFVGHDFVVFTLITFGLARSLVDTAAASRAPVPQPVTRMVPQAPLRHFGPGITRTLAVLLSLIALALVPAGTLRADPAAAAAAPAAPAITAVYPQMQGATLVDSK